eukprot:m.83197 g.83197  ORF g.83197 m.83197 type:complete len:486 (+) comp9522_c0_seq2:134-1591(+)
MRRVVFLQLAVLGVLSSVTDVRADETVTCDPVSQCRCAPGWENDNDYVNPDTGCAECRCVRLVSGSDSGSGDDEPESRVESTLVSTPVPSSTLPSVTVVSSTVTTGAGLASVSTTSMADALPTTIVVATSAPGTAAPTSVAGVTLAPISGAPSPPSRCTYMVGQTYAGQSMEILDPAPATAVDCGDACASIVGCVGYSYESDHCALFQNIVGLLQSPKHTSIVTGTCDAVARAAVRTLATDGCSSLANVNMGGIDLMEKVDTGDAAGCAALCLALEDCTHYTFLESQCHLKAAGAKAPRAEANTMSGTCRTTPKLGTETTTTTLSPTPQPTMRPTREVIRVGPGDGKAAEDSGGLNTTRRWMIIATVILSGLVFGLALMAIAYHRRTERQSAVVTSRFQEAPAHHKEVPYGAKALERLIDLKNGVIFDDGFEYDPAGTGEETSFNSIRFPASGAGEMEAPEPHRAAMPPAVREEVALRGETASPA